MQNDPQAGIAWALVRTLARELSTANDDQTDEQTDELYQQIDQATSIQAVDPLCLIAALTEHFGREVG